MKKLLIVLILFFSYTTYSQTAKEYFNSAYDKEENGNFNGAIADYTKAIELNPDDASAYNNRGILKEELGDLDGACSDWRKAANLGHTNAKKWVANQCN